jgi:hypothetical protein
MSSAEPTDASAELILRSSRSKAWFRFLILLSVTGVYIGLAVRYSDCLLLWLVALIGVAWTFKTLTRALDRSACLRLTPRGFAVHERWSVLAFSWDEIKNFEVGNRGRSVLFNYADSGETASGARRVAHFLAGGDGALPDTYGMGAAELASLMESWRRRFGSSVNREEHG